MAIVTVKSLDGNDIEPYAKDLYKQLGIGKRKKTTACCCLWRRTTGSMGEVGYGLEPVINDARAGDAGRPMVPYFRQGDYSSGITAAHGSWRNILPTIKA